MGAKVSSLSATPDAVPSPRPLDSIPPESERVVRALAVLATAATFLLIAVGGLVRATGSGLGCTGWPKCTANSFLPPLEYHALIEYSHRFLAFIDVVLIGALAVGAARRRRRAPPVFTAASLAVGLVLVQAVLGGVVVHGELAALLVSAHLGTALVLAGTLVVATVAAFSAREEPRPGPPGDAPVAPDPGFARFAWLVAGAALALILVGATVRAEGAGLAFPDWPLMDGEVVPEISSLRPALHFAHRALALGVGVLVAVLAWRGRRIRAHSPGAFVLARLAAGLFLSQALIGAAAVWSRLAPVAIVAHVAVSSLTWGALVGAAAAVGFRGGPAR
jgi:heme A synthase